MVGRRAALVNRLQAGAVAPGIGEMDRTRIGADASHRASSRLFLLRDAPPMRDNFLHWFRARAEPRPRALPPAPTTTTFPDRSPSVPHRRATAIADPYDGGRRRA